MAYYQIEEQETTTVYDSVKKVFNIYTTVPKHIRRLELYTQKNGAILEKMTPYFDSEGKTIALQLFLKKLPSASLFNQ
ncbi:hypothetical protein [Bacillus xiapuensis]|uniref:Uncharacterized protein n=1 Tax=Bacillus xiapuensis TaxID=2014075 RepID=A0ABU6N8L2_9BACI|nr:hypothetical protein [Bacillus xiapuensis]